VHSMPFHLSYISQPFLFFAQHNMTCLSVWWTIWALNEEISICTFYHQAADTC